MQSDLFELSPLRRFDHAALRYDIGEQVARGGMGSVYRVRDRFTGRWLALKRPWQERAGDASSALSNFEREYDTLASLRHPGVIRVYDYAWDDIGPYFTMEWVQGRDLSEVAPMHWRQVCKILRELASALALLHARNLLHRDLSPSNVRLNANGDCKLLDFGALIPCGQASTIVGTAPCVPPEAFFTRELDQRADIYGLGALAYWLLTGVHAYPTQRIEQLPGLWCRPPTPPSFHVVGIPAALETLVQFMLHQDRDARPSNMAEVIVRLNVIARLEPSGTEAQAASSYFIKPPVQGRAEALACMLADLQAASQGTGAAVCVEAVEGGGKTRFLDELCRRARYARFDVLRVDIAAGGVVEPERSEASHGADILTRREPIDARALCARIERSLSSNAERPVLVAIDNLHACTEADLALFRACAARAWASRALLVFTDLPCPSDGGRAALRGQLRSLALEPLSRDQTHALVRSMFGDVPRVDRLARWTYELAGGNPEQSVNVARRLLERGAARYVDGMWLLPSRGPHTPPTLSSEPPASAGNLAEDQRELARCFSLLRVPPTILLGEALIGELTSDRDALPALLRSGTLVHEGGTLRVATAALCEQLAAESSRQERLALHRRLAEGWRAVAAQNGSACLLEAGWHQMESGERSLGAKLVASVAAGDLLLHMRRVGPPFGEVFAAALTIQRYEGRSLFDQLPLLSALAHAGLYEDVRWFKQHGEHTLRAVGEATGLHLARELAPLLGGRISLLVATLVAVLRFGFRRDYSLMRMFELCFSTTLALVCTASACLDPERAQVIASTLQPLAVLSQRAAPRGVFDFCEALKELASDSPSRVFEQLDAVRQKLLHTRYYRGLSEQARFLMHAGTHCARGLLAVLRLDGAPALESADILLATEVPAYVSAARQMRYLYHVNRGELRRAREYQHHYELAGPSLGSNWAPAPWEQVALLSASLTMGDVNSLLQISASLDELAHDTPRLRSYQRLATQAARIAAEEAADTLSSLDNVQRLARDLQVDVCICEQRNYIGAARAQAALAALYNAAERYQEAEQLCRTSLARLQPGDERYVALFLELELQCALADFGLRRERAAQQRLDGLLGRLQRSDHPLALGRLHEVRANIARAMDRAPECAEELALVEHYYRGTGNPTLIAKYERLAEHARGESTLSLRGPSAHSLHDQLAVTQVGAPPDEYSAR